MKKVISIVRWGMYMCINLIGFISAPVIFPILNPFRNYISNLKPFWFYFDDEDGIYGTPWFRESRKSSMDTAWGSL